MSNLPIEAALPVLLLAGGVSFFVATELAFRHATERALRDLEAAFHRRLEILRRDPASAPAADRLEEIRDGFREILARRGWADPPRPRGLRAGSRPPSAPPARAG